jgi:UDP-perosamine 4-acetyltransferase
MEASNNVVIIGYGGHAISVISACLSLGYTIVGYTNHKKNEKADFALHYLGNDEVYLSNPLKSCLHFCAVGDNQQRQTIQTNYLNHGLLFTNIIHPSAFLEQTVTLGRGIYIGAMTYLGGLVNIDDGAIINNHVSVDHDCYIGKFTHIGPKSCLTGNVTIKERVFLGCGSNVIPGIVIQSDVIVGAGSVVIHNIEQGKTVKGSPAK